MKKCLSDREKFFHRKLTYWNSFCFELMQKVFDRTEFGTNDRPVVNFERTRWSNKGCDGGKCESDFHILMSCDLLRLMMRSMSDNLYFFNADFICFQWRSSAPIFAALFKNCSVESDSDELFGNNVHNTQKCHGKFCFEYQIGILNVFSHVIIGITRNVWLRKIFFFSLVKLKHLTVTVRAGSRLPKSSLMLITAEMSTIAQKRCKRPPWNSKTNVLVSKQKFFFAGNFTGNEPKNDRKWHF